jgi:hypothetical protein
LARVQKVFFKINRTKTRLNQREPLFLVEKKRKGKSEKERKKENRVVLFSIESKR